MQLDETLAAAIQEVGQKAAVNANNNGIIVLAVIDGKLFAGAAGDRMALPSMVAQALNADNLLAEIVKTGIDIAPLVKEVTEGSKCECSNCVAKRERAATDPNVN